jgi:predicted nuclease of predicted toxin-antitoxin system
VKLLLDQGVPRSTSQLLQKSGIDAVHTSEIGFSTHSDSEIISFAVSQNRSIVTLDADFHAILAHMRAGKPSVIRIRIDGLKAEAMSKLILSLVEKHHEAIFNGAAISVTRARTAIHHLPLNSGLDQ